MPDSATGRCTVATAAGVPLVAAFDGGRLTSDGGLPWLAEAGAAPRLPLLKLGGRIYQLRSHVRLALASAHPGQALWTLLGSLPSSRVHHPG